MTAFRDTPSQWVVVAGGEKDCDNGAAIGLLTTCNVEGEGVWSDTYGQQLQGRNVIIFPDNDEVGWKHAGCVAFNLRKHGCVVRLVVPDELPPKGDLTCWLVMTRGDAQAKRGALMELARRSTAWEPIH